ncbi:MAG: hypothetical protein IKS05_08840 [Oscillospiraceae bacterium]|nr:hypothetical protein [Oscillospiraceae bacterium]
MKQRMIDLLRADKDTEDYAGAVFGEFGLSVDKHYDLLVVAPAWKPTRIMESYDVEISCTAEHAYLSGYEVKYADRLIAWIQCSPGASSLIDELSLCAVLDFDKLVFVGAVGALVPDISLGELCTPSWCVEGNLANGYLEEDILSYKPFGKVFPNDPAFVARVAELVREMGFAMRQEPVFCTDSIYCEYAHMDFILRFGARLIEMETSSFYRLADLMEKPAIALMAVSDNTSTGNSLLVRSEAQRDAYNQCRMQRIPRIILEIARRKEL